MAKVFLLKLISSFEFRIFDSLLNSFRLSTILPLSALVKDAQSLRTRRLVSSNLSEECYRGISGIPGGLMSSKRATVKYLQQCEDIPINDLENMSQTSIAARKPYLREGLEGWLEMPRFRPMLNTTSRPKCSFLLIKLRNVLGLIPLPVLQPWVFHGEVANFNRVRRGCLTRMSTRVRALI